MGKYQAMFVDIDGLDETEVGASYGLIATERGAAEDEALTLPRPAGATSSSSSKMGNTNLPRLGLIRNA